MGLLFKNNAETTLSSGINNSVTTVPVASAAVFPTPDANNVFFATIEEGNTVEVVKVTGISSNDLTVVRAQDNTSAAAFGAGAKIELRLTAKILEMGTSSLTDLDGDTQILVEEAADEDKIKFKAAGTEIARIDSTGLGIGGVNPTEKLTVDGNIANISGDLTLDVAGQIILDADSGYWYFNDGGTTIGYVENSSSNLVIRSHVNDKDIIFTGTDNNSGITALTLDMSEAGAATFNSTVSFKFVNSSWISSADGVNRLYYATNGTSYYKTGDDHQFRNSSDATKVSFDSSGNAIFAGNVTAYGSPSDLKLKENVEVIDNAVDKVKQLKGVTYTLKSDGNRLTGLVAQDLEKVLPEAVYTEKDIETKDEHLAIRYGNTVGLLVEAIKEQQEQIEALTAKVKELEDK